jgi:hypothetical protein
MAMIPYHNWPETPIKRIGDTVIVHRGPLYVVRRGEEERYCHCDAMAERIAREMEICSRTATGRSSKATS